MLNIVGAIAISHKMGISLKALRPAVRRLEGVPHRLQLTDKGGVTVIDDAYNSNPSGTKAALEALNLFDGYKILHISDFHLGSLYGDEEIVSKWVDMMNAENPDVICFTGDMVSILADEMASHMDALKRLKAKDGKFAIIGNHDYGDYHKWSSMEARDANLAKTEENIRQAGFDLLLNENRTICRNGDTISVVGIENWGRPPFPQNSDLKKAETGIASSTRILLSHDPDFWEYKLEDNTDYFLTLSGHTHAMQLGIEIGDWEISPSSLKYPYWHGLYERNGIQIVVSRGIGCTAIPFRIGMSPEYVVITLKK